MYIQAAIVVRQVVYEPGPLGIVNDVDYIRIPFAHL